MCHKWGLEVSGASNFISVMLSSEQNSRLFSINYNSQLNNAKIFDTFVNSFLSSKGCHSHAWILKWFGIDRCFPFFDKWINYQVTSNQLILTFSSINFSISWVNLLVLFLKINLQPCWAPLVTDITFYYVWYVLLCPVHLNDIFLV